MKNCNLDGSELHRLKPMKKGYDEQLFNKLYKLVTPVIHNLVRQIDVRKFDVPKDVITSYFYDKMLYIFNRYYGEISEEHLKANILRGLSVYKNHLLHYAYTDKADFNQSLRSLDDLFDKDKEFIDEEDPKKIQDEKMGEVDRYMQKHLSSDAQLVWEVLTTPPPYIETHMKFNRITNILIAEFFNLPKTRSSVKYIGELREEVNHWITQASHDLGKH